MIDFHTHEILEEVRDLIVSRHEDSEEMDEDDRLSSAEDLLQDILDRITPLIERES